MGYDKLAGTADPLLYQTELTFSRPFLKDINRMKQFPYLLGALLVVLTVAACQEDASELALTNPEADSGTVTIDSVLGDILRTPPSRFDDLPGYDFKANYVDVGLSGPLMMHYIDEGPADGPVVVLLHGNPAWSYLVREMVPPLTSAGYRVIAPDLIGFGKSDKPAARSAHTYDNHTAWVSKFFQVLDFREVTFHVQDWGGLIGLRVAIYERERFARVAASNTALPDGYIGNEQAFSVWRDNISQNVATFSTVIERATPTDLSPEEEAAYDAPYPTDEYTAGPRELPKAVPFDPTDPEAIENQQVLEQWKTWEKPLMTIFTAVDPDRADLSSTAGGQDQLRSRAPGAEGQPHVLIPEDQAGHYIREDVPEAISTYLIDFIKNN